MSNELTTLIDKLVTEKTFSVDGVKAIEQLRQKAAAQEDKIGLLEIAAKELKRTYDMIEADRQRLRGKEDTFIKREAELVAREAKVAEHEKTAAVAVAKADAFMFALTTVFKPNTVRETIMKSTPMLQQYAGGGSNITYGTHSDQSTREEGA